jgi:hypothetical protein
MTRSLLVVALLLLPSPGVKAQGGAVTDIKLIATNVGWAERGGRLYWTNDNGANWKDITPPGDGTIGGIFFLDGEKGWMTINHDRDRFGEPDIRCCLHRRRGNDLVAHDGPPAAQGLRHYD